MDTTSQAEQKELSSDSTGKQPKDGLYRILCLDGGGAKGFYTLGFLRELEAALGVPLEVHFHAIYGTSTGAIIASLLGLGKSAVETLKLYEENVPSILGAKGASKKSSELKRVADQLFHGYEWSDFKTGIGIVATYWTREKPLLFKNKIDTAYGIALKINRLCLLEGCNPLRPQAS